MPGTYDSDERKITLHTELQHEPVLTMATLIHFVVADLLHQKRYAKSHLPEIVDTAVIATGLGAPHSGIGFVHSGGSFWDTTEWEVLPKSFLPTQMVAYANALAAWLRSETAPTWAAELPIDVRKPMLKSLKFLWKTNDSFFRRSGDKEKSFHAESLDDASCCNLMRSDLASSQIIGSRQLPAGDVQNPDHVSALQKLMRSNRTDVVTHAIAATERIKLTDSDIVDELHLLTEHREDLVKARSMCALTRMGALSDSAIEIAGRMLTSSAKFAVYAGLAALSTRDKVPSSIIALADRGFEKSLANCDYEFINLYIVAYEKWLDDPAEHFRALLEEHSPEYFEIAIESLKNQKQSLVSIGNGKDS